ncbi:condensation domain-containing protein [Kitasatospora aureofaciens]|uniref:condensation domain-containing protein n=1 Tax=Kitasatospora aureofaciens TaxID=1894 RepID=UPI0037C84E71
MNTKSSDELTAPLSYQQQELLRQIREAPQCAAMFDNVYLYELCGPVEIDCLAQAVRDVVQRHAALRTTIGTLEGEDVQRIDPVVSDGILPVGSAETLDGLIADLSARRLQSDAVSAGLPLFRAEAHRVGDRLLVSFSLHHLVSDGWSDAILWRDLSECYAARLDRRAPELPPLTGSYAEFARKQRRWWEESRSTVVSFWERELAGWTDDIAWSRIDPGANASYERDLEVLDLDPETVRRVRDTARTARVTPFIVLLAATAVGVSRLTGRHEVLLGSNVAGREDLSRLDAIGYFTNTRLTVARIRPGEPLSELVSSLRDHWFTGDQHRDAYIDQLSLALGRPGVVKVDMLDLPGTSDSPDSGLPAAPVLPGVEVKPVEVGSEDLHWRELHFNWVPVDGSYQLELRYRPARTARETVIGARDRIAEVLHDLDGLM